MVLLQYIGGASGFLTYLLFAFILYKKSEIFNQNFTTWVLCGIIDIFMTITTADGNFWLSLAYGIGSFIVAWVIWYKQKEFLISKWDMIIAIIILFICLPSYFCFGKNIAIIAGITASIISFIPQIRETAHYPRKTPIIIYFLFLISDISSSFGGRDYSIKEISYGIAETGLSNIIKFLVVYNRTRK
jgi:hypothetical protein